MARRKPSKRNWIAALTIVAILTVVGVVPTLILIIGPIAISSAALAGLFLLARRYEVIGGD